MSLSNYAASSIATSKLPCDALSFEEGAHRIQCPPDHAARSHSTQQKCAASHARQMRHRRAEMPRRTKPHQSHGGRGCGTFVGVSRAFVSSPANGEKDPVAASAQTQQRQQRRGSSSRWSSSSRRANQLSAPHVHDFVGLPRSDMMAQGRHVAHDRSCHPLVDAILDLSFAHARPASSRMRTGSGRFGHVDIMIPPSHSRLLISVGVYQRSDTRQMITTQAQRRAHADACAGCSGARRVVESRAYGERRGASPRESKKKRKTPSEANPSEAPPLLLVSAPSEAWDGGQILGRFMGNFTPGYLLP